MIARVLLLSTLRRYAFSRLPSRMLPEGGGSDASMPLLYVEPEKRGACVAHNEHGVEGFEASGGVRIEVLGGGEQSFGLRGARWRATMCCANHMGVSVSGFAPAQSGLLHALTRPRAHPPPLASSPPFFGRLALRSTGGNRPCPRAAGSAWQAVVFRLLTTLARRARSSKSTWHRARTHYAAMGRGPPASS